MTRQLREDRRAFLRRMQAVLAGGTAFALLPQLDLVGRAMAADALPGNDYKALVCIFLFGGSDSFNMLIPHDSAEYNAYSTSRGGVYDAATNPTGLGYARDQLVTIADTDGKTWGLNPGCTAMKPLFEAGELAFLANVGTLVEPVTKTEVNNKLKRLPAYLYSHNDQQRQWMRGHATTTHAANGWGGLCGDRLAALNTGLSALPPTISIFGNNLYQSGASVLPYAVASNGPGELARMASNGGSADAIRLQALEELLHANQGHAMRTRYAGLGETSIMVNGALRQALDPANGGDIATTFSGEPLAAQLRMIARLVKVSQEPAIGHKRQIFYAGLGGFDTHDNQMDPTRHAALLSQVAGALAAFRAALQEIGMLDRVTTFTMSDFGRTLNSNGNGTDHAWGGVQLVMGAAAGNGGSLQGRRVWGDYPLLELDGEQSMGRGRMIPTTSIQQVGATLASWMGVAEADLGTIFPGIGNFDAPRLGFLG